MYKKKIKDIYGNVIIFQILELEGLENKIYVDIEGPRGGRYANLVFSNVGFGKIIQIIKEIEASTISNQ